MKQPVVDYRKLRLSNITSPEYRHLLLLLGWVVYFAFYFLTENLIPAEKCHPMHCFIDDIIPFNEWFVFAYVGWYLLIVVSLGYFLLYNPRNFSRLQTYIIVTQVLAMAAYILYPSRQDLRPEVLPNDNFPSKIVALLYALDTNTGVCPSLHVAYSFGIGSTWMREKSAAWWWKALVWVFVVVICLSTMFIKQHSAVDFFAALPVCMVAEWFTFFRKPSKVKNKNCRPTGRQLFIERSFQQPIRNIHDFYSLILILVMPRACDYHFGIAIPDLPYYAISVFQNQ